MRLKSREPSQLIYSLKIGDGCFVQNSTGERFGKATYNLLINSINLDYLVHKKTELERMGIITQPLRTAKSGYKEDSIIYVFGTRIHHYITSVANMKTVDILHKLDKQGLIYYFLDDGTFHQKKHFGHICCNTFNDEEVETLIKVMYKFYPQKLCTKRIDRKKDGRQYPYIYIPVVVMNEFRKDIYKFLKENHIESLLYKVGENSA